MRLQNRGEVEVIDVHGIARGVKKKAVYVTPGRRDMLGGIMRARRNT